jgi:hypothetical protein
MEERTKLRFQQIGKVYLIGIFGTNGTIGQTGTTVPAF